MEQPSGWSEFFPYGVRYTGCPATHLLWTVCYQALPQFIIVRNYVAYSVCVIC